MPIARRLRKKIRLDFLSRCAFFAKICYNGFGSDISTKEGIFTVDNNEVTAFARDFFACRGILTALGDETRQHLIFEMIQIGNCNGVRVGEITAKTHLSRPAVSHHLRILKEAGIVKVRKEGTKNYYYFDPSTEALHRLTETLRKAETIARKLPDRSEE